MTPDPGEQRRVARNLARRALLDLACTDGAQAITRSAFGGSHTTMRDAHLDAGAARTALRRAVIAAQNGSN